MKPLTDKKNLLPMILLMFALSWMSVKICLPALPVLISIFHTAPDAIKFTVSAFFFAFALSQLVWGTLCDFIGRRKTLLIGFSGAIVGTLLVIFSVHYWMYLLGRAAEGFFIGSVSAAGRSIVADVYDKSRAASVFGTISSITCFMPAVAPVIGGFILEGFGWRAIFIFFCVAISAFSLFLWRWLPETRPSNIEPQLGEVFGNYFMLLKHKRYWQYSIPYMLSMGVLLGYYGAMPFWYVNQYHYADNHYAFLALYTVGVFFFGLQLTRYLVKYFSCVRLIKAVLVMMLLLSVFIIVLYGLSVHGAWILVLLLSLHGFICGVISPAVNAEIMHDFRHVAGIVSATTTIGIFISAGVITWILSHLEVLSLSQFAVVYLVYALLCSSAYHLLARKKT